MKIYNLFFVILGTFCVSFFVYFRLTANKETTRAFVEPGKTYLTQTDGIATNLTVVGLNVFPEIEFNSTDTLTVSNSVVYINNEPIIIPNIDLATMLNTTYKYPVFKFELGGTWTDFELKASTNNFESLVYYYVSSQTNSYGADDPYPFTFYLDDYNNDVRVWFNATPHVPILSQLIDNNSEVEYVYFMPSRTCGIDADTWMWQNNTNLIWSWVRFDGINFEMNATETKQHWNPIRPERWEINRTVP